MIDRDLDDKISILYQIGHSYTQIARRLDVGYNLVRTSLKRTNTIVRSISQAKKTSPTVSLRLPEGKR